MRKQTRVSFRSLFRIKACNPQNEELIGYVADVSASGLRLLSDTLIDPNSRTTLRLKMRLNEDEVLQMDVRLRCMWSRENHQTGRCEAGFALTEQSAEFTRLVENLLAIRTRS